MSYVLALLVAAGLWLVAWRNPGMWPYLGGGALVLLALAVGGDDGPGGPVERARAHPVYRRWRDGGFPFEGEV